jgi:hypothetical protein
MFIRKVWIIVGIWEYRELFLRWGECEVCVEIGTIIAKVMALVHGVQKRLVEIEKVLPVINVWHLEVLSALRSICIRRCNIL